MTLQERIDAVQKRRPFHLVDRGSLISAGSKTHVQQAHRRNFRLIACRGDVELTLARGTATEMKKLSREVKLALGDHYGQGYSALIVINTARIEVNPRA